MASRWALLTDGNCLMLWISVSMDAEVWEISRESRTLAFWAMGTAWEMVRMEMEWADRNVRMAERAPLSSLTIREMTARLVCLLSS